MNQHQWLIFLPAALLVAASPGAGNFLALTHGLRGGWGIAVTALLGRFTAFAIMILLVMLGVGALLAASAVAFSILKWAGVAYLVWLGLRLWRSDALPLAGSVEDAPRSWRALTTREFTVAVTNPKAMLLFTAFLPQFLVSGRPMAGQFVMLGGAYILIEFAAASGYAFAGSRIKALRLTRRGARRVNRITGAIMTAAASWLATIKRTARRRGIMLRNRYVYA